MAGYKPSRRSRLAINGHTLAAVVLVLLSLLLIATSWTSWQTLLSARAIRLPWIPAARDDNGPHRFPRIILQTVRDKNDIACEVLDSMKTWRDLNPGYKHYLFDDDDCRSFMQKFHPDMLNKYNGLPSNVERSDMWRYLVMYTFGGVYADTDVQCLRPIEEWNAENNHDARVLVGMEGALVIPVHFQQWTLVGTPKHALFLDMATHIKPFNQSTDEATDAATLDRTGPGMWSNEVHNYFQHHVGYNSSNLTLNSSSTRIGDVRVMPVVYLARGWAQKCSEVAAETPEAYVCHQFHGSWKTRFANRPNLNHGCPTPPEYLEPIDLLTNMTG